VVSASVDILARKTLATQRDFLRVLMMPCVYMANVKMGVMLSTKSRKRMGAMNEEWLSVELRAILH
jgi:hypothetical protein